MDSAKNMPAASMTGRSRRGKDQFIQVVSCNTHNLAVLIDTIALGPEKEDNLAESRFVCMRRANDLSQEGDFIPAPEAGKHDDPKFGTHQGRDAHYLFKTLGLDLDIYSSALKLNTQYMHTIHFNLKLRRGITKDELMRRLQKRTCGLPSPTKNLRRRCFRSAAIMACSAEFSIRPWSSVKVWPCAATRRSSAPALRPRMAIRY